MQHRGGLMDGWIDGSLMLIITKIFSISCGECVGNLNCIIGDSMNDNDKLSIVKGDKIE